MTLPSAQILQKAFIGVLQQLTFLFASPDPDGAEASGASETGTEADAALAWSSLRIAFAGPHSGEVGLRLPRSLQIEIAANFLGLDSESPEAEAHAEDASREVLNVVAGHVLSDWAGESAVFDLRPDTLPAANGKAPDLSERFDIEGSPAVLSFTLAGPNLQEA